jgi:hypothetical protein
MSVELRSSDWVLVDFQEEDEYVQVWKVGQSIIIEDEEPEPLGVAPSWSIMKKIRGIWGSFFSQKVGMPKKGILKPAKVVPVVHWAQISVREEEADVLVVRHAALAAAEFSIRARNALAKAQKCADPGHVAKHQRRADSYARRAAEHRQECEAAKRRLEESNENLPFLDPEPICGE